MNTRVLTSGGSTSPDQQFLSGVPGGWSTEER